MPDDRQRAKGLSKEQKIGFVLLFVFAILAVGLGFLQIRNSLYGPFALNKTVPTSLVDELNTPEILQFRDTDMDGLNDFEELYIYTTSPYLADTDSDGISDSQEIGKGTNPNCAEGRDCTGVVNSAEWVATSTINVSVDDPGEAPADLNEALQDPAQVRLMLMQAGADEQLLQQFSDADIINLVQEMMMSSSSEMQMLIDMQDSASSNVSNPE